MQNRMKGTALLRARTLSTSKLFELLLIGSPPASTMALYADEHIGLQVHKSQDFFVTY